MTRVISPAAMPAVKSGTLPQKPSVKGSPSRLSEQMTMHHPRMGRVRQRPLMSSMWSASAGSASEPGAGARSRQARTANTPTFITP